jgi:ABC-type oligopeptide transport system substrate-binding subunit/DNA-binding SARP family transcriptional activator
MSRLSLHLLGPPRLDLDGEPLNVGRRKAVALIAYLAVTGHGHTRDALATLLWPEFDQSRARAGLRRTLSTLNRALDGAWIEADRESIDLMRGDDLWVDVTVFRSRLAEIETHDHPDAEGCPDCLSRLAEATDLYQDEFMAGFTLRDSPEFDDWQFFQAENLRRELAGALERLTRAHCDRGEYELAVDYARRWLHLDPLHEDAHRQLMQLYARSDQRPAALRQYQECVRILEAELGVPPSSETTDLHQRIQAGQLGEGAEKQGGSGPEVEEFQCLEDFESLGTPPFLEARPEPKPGTPFVAREEELAQLRSHLDGALSGLGRVAFITGEAGSGKTALIHEFARRAQEAIPNLVVAIGNCNAHTGLGDPYLPFREILGLLTGDVEARYAQGAITRENARRLWAALPASIEALVKVGPDLIDSLVPRATLTARVAALRPEPAGWADRLERLIEPHGTDDAKTDVAQRDLFEQYTQFLTTLSRRQPLLLVIDDAQWADAASINLLFHVSRGLAGGQVLLVVTYRPDEVALGRGGERHPLEPVINELRRTYGDVWTELEPTMGRRFIDALLAAKPNRLGEEFRAALTRQTQGHPLFTIELLHAMQQRGDLTYDPHGRWIEGPSLAWQTLPARVEAVIEERVGRLEASLREILAVASVEGETFTAQVVARVQGLGERPVLGILSQELERRHQLVQARGEIQVDHKFLSRYQFTHTVFQQYLYNTFGPGERRLLHGEIASALEDLYEDEGEQVTVQLARHYAEAGQVERAVEYLLRAGDRARDLYAFHEAIDFYKRALAFLRGGGDHERAARTLMKLGLTYHLAFKFEHAREAYGEAFDLWQRVGTNQAPSVPPAPHPLRLIWSDPPSIDPALATDSVSNGIIFQLFSGLVRLNAELDVVPELARSWDVQGDGERYIFHLREDARWSDGRPVTAQDFVYAWRRVLSPALESPIAGYLYDIKGAQAYHQGQLSDPDQVGVRAPDETTLLVELEGPTGYFPHVLTYPVGYAVPPHVVEAHGPAWTEPEHLVTNGPFRLERWQSGHSLVLTRNPDYPCEFTGNVEQVSLGLSVDDPSQQIALYEADRLDIVFINPSPEASRARQRHADEYFSSPGLSTQYIGFNVAQPPFEDPRVRRAFALAIDKERLASVALSGGFFPATGGFVPPGMPGHSPGIGLPYDPERARRLMAEAGYPAGRGFPAVECLRRSIFGDVDCDYLRAGWGEVLGVNIEWQIIEWSQFLERLDHRPPNIYRLGWVVDYPDPDNTLRLSRHQPWSRWQDERYIELVERARRATDQPERMKLYQQADQMLMQEAPIVPILYGRFHWLVKPWTRYSVSPISWTSWKDAVVEPH